MQHHQVPLASVAVPSQPRWVVSLQNHSKNGVSLHDFAVPLSQQDKEVTVETLSGDDSLGLVRVGAGNGNKGS